MSTYAERLKQWRTEKKESSTRQRAKNKAFRAFRRQNKSKYKSQEEAELDFNKQHAATRDRSKDPVRKHYVKPSKYASHAEWLASLPPPKTKK